MKQSMVTAAVTAGLIGGSALAYYIYRKKQRLPTEWQDAGTIQNIYLYPVKSCGLVEKDIVECTVLGPKVGWLRDRVLMVVDEKDNFITARGYPDLVLVQPSVRGTILTLNYSGKEPLKVDLAAVTEGFKKTAQIWGTAVPVYDCGLEASDWFTELLGKPGKRFKLVYYATDRCRELGAAAHPSFYKYTKNDTGALPDEASFNLINEASVEDLKTRVKGSSISHNNFRPNFVMKGCEAYKEDEWKYIKIGSCVFEIIKPCTRCLLTTIDPETGVKNAKAEPLETLRSYRQVVDPVERRAVGAAPKMGLSMALRTPGGIISVHDRVYVA